MQLDTTTSASEPPAATTPAAPTLADRRRRENLWALFFIGPQLLGLLAFVLGPLVFALTLSMVRWDGFGAATFVGFANFAQQLGDETFQTSFWNTVFFTVLAVPGELVCGLMVAIALNKTRGKLVYRLLFFMPVVTSSVAVSVVWMWLLNGDFGPLNSYLRDWFGLNPPNWLVDASFVIPAMALVSVWRGLGYTMVIFLAGLQGIPDSYVEAAHIDGAGGIRRFFHITLPMISPTILFLTITSLIGSFQVFDVAYIMTQGGPGDASRTLIYQVYTLAFEQLQFGPSAAAAVVLFLLLMGLTLAQLAAQRRWVHYED